MGPEGLDVASQAWRVDARGAFYAVVSRSIQDGWLTRDSTSVVPNFDFLLALFFGTMFKHTFNILYLSRLFLGGQGYVEIISLPQ